MRIVCVLLITVVRTESLDWCGGYPEIEMRVKVGPRDALSRSDLEGLLSIKIAIFSHLGSVQGPTLRSDLVSPSFLSPDFRSRMMS